MVKLIYINVKEEVLMDETTTPKFDYTTELRKLMNKRFHDDLEAKIALSRFRIVANASGHRGKHKNLGVRNSRVVFVK